VRGALRDGIPRRETMRTDGQIPRPDVLGDPLAEPGLESIQAEEWVGGSELASRRDGHQVIGFDTACLEPAPSPPTGEDWGAINGGVLFRGAAVLYQAFLPRYVAKTPAST